MNRLMFFLLAYCICMWCYALYLFVIYPGFFDREEQRAPSQFNARMLIFFLLFPVGHPLTWIIYRLKGKKGYHPNGH